jgi:type II secretory pathway pseudopilin PulG
MDEAMKEMKERSSGLTLLEIVVITVVLAVILAMSLPTLGAAKKQTNEASAITTLRTVSAAQLQYRTRYGTYADLGELTGVGLLDAGFNDSEKAGYRFVSSNAPSSSTWAMVAEPVLPGVSGDRYFYVDESGVIRYREDTTASLADVPVD